MAVTKEELQERAQLVRMHEASCKIEYPTVDQLNFHIATMKLLGKAFNMKEVRNFKIDGPVTQAPRPPRVNPNVK